jgi:predicted metal-binding membrane protein
MLRMAGRHQLWLLLMAATIMVAWLLLIFAGGSFSLPAFCSARGWSAVPLSVSVELALLFNSPGQLAIGWALMVLAMMLPLAIAPLWHVRERSFARRRGRSTALFVAGFVAVWMLAGVILQSVALRARLMVAEPLACLGLALAVGLLWQVSPAKQWFLNRCHQRPSLAAFGFAADLDAFAFGVRNGVACAGACWALMLAMLLIGQGQMPAMIVVTLFSLAQSIEDPAPLAWRWRGGAKALRILAAWWPGRQEWLGHDPEKCVAVFRKDRAQSRI